MTSFTSHQHPMASASMDAAGTPEAARPLAAWPPAAWLCALSPDHRWALVYDKQCHNIAEIHRPALPTGPDDGIPPLPFEQVVALMRAAPQLCALLQETIAPGGIGKDEFLRPGGYRERALALLRTVGMLPEDPFAEPPQPELLARLAVGAVFRFVSDPEGPVFVRSHGGFQDPQAGDVAGFHPEQLVYPVRVVGSESDPDAVPSL